MSALSYLNEYGDNSEESDSELDCKPLKRPKLPVPNLTKVTVVPVNEHKDDPHLHGGRTRSFPHVRGNWATFVFLQYLGIEELQELLDKLEVLVLSKLNTCHRCEDLHISLSKTVVLKYHLISSFTASLQQNLKNISSFNLGFDSVKVYCNEENSRTFISLEVNPFTAQLLSTITKKIDQVLEDFQLPTFYTDPSFHMSIFWVNGDKQLELNSILDLMNEALFQEVDKSLKTNTVNTINCKVGNKLFQYPLS